MNPWDIALHLVGAKRDEGISHRVRQKKYMQKPEAKAKRNKREREARKYDGELRLRLSERNRAWYQRKKQDPVWYAAMLERTKENKRKLREARRAMKEGANVQC
jgi:hypothetical protein